MEEDERMNFNSFVDAYNAYQNPNLAPVAPAFGGYNYQAPQLNMVQAPNQLPPMSINPDAIYDPTVGAAMQILNRPMMMAQTPGLLGSGTDYQQQFGLLPDIAPVRMQQYQRMADPVSLIDSIGVGSGSDNYGNNGGDGGYNSNLRYNDTMNTGTFVDEFGRTVSNTGSIGLQDYLNFGIVQDAQGGFLGDGAYGGTIGNTGMGVNSQGQTVSNLGTIAAQNNAMFGGDAYYNSESP
jgi:hypothetical protein